MYMPVENTSYHNGADDRLITTYIIVNFAKKTPYWQNVQTLQKCEY